MDIAAAAELFSEIGHEKRLEIIRLLVRAGPEGLTVSELKNRLLCPDSTLSHHISKLCRVGMVQQIRSGRHLKCHANYQILNELTDYLYQECCIESNPDCCEPKQTTKSKRTKK